MTRNHNDRPRALPVLSGALTAPSAVPPPAGDGVRIGLVTLGCDKNTVDSERILARLVGAGARVSSDVEGADVVVVNTCGFIDAAKEESVDAILEAVRLKEEGGTRAVVAMGCLVQRYRAGLEAELPEVDLLLGLTEADRLLPELRARGLLPRPDGPVPVMEQPLRVLSTRTPHTSFLKISEGCDHSCAFCAIPLMRGRHRSTPIEILVREARELEASGVVELNLVSQDTTWYGRDWARGGERDGGAGDFFVGKPFAGMAGIAPQADAATRGSNGRGSAAGARAAVGVARHGALPGLLHALLEGTGIAWFRLFYMYPSGIRPELVELIAREARILPYLDMPIQHGSDAVLARMRRPERQATIRERVRWLRDAVPELVLRTTVIVGFPGETEADFEAMLDLLEEIRFDRLGAFAYSVEEGTPAAVMAEQLPDSVKRERLERLLDVQRSISLERDERHVGREMPALVDRLAGAGEVLGRTPGQALEVDGATRIRVAKGVRPGEFVKVRITGANEEELEAEQVADA